MKRAAIIVGGLVVALFAGGLILSLISRLKPSELYIHLPADSWQDVIIESDHLPSPQKFSPDGPPPKISPVIYGVYRIRIEFRDGQVLWATFLHHDAGVRRRLDITVARQQDGSVTLTQTANHSRILFKGATRPSDTTPDKPFVLDWTSARQNKS